MDNRSKTPCGLWLFVLEICLFSTGSVSLFWDVKPAKMTTAELGKNITISWGYQLQANETFTSSNIFINGQTDIANRAHQSKKYSIKPIQAKKYKIISFFRKSTKLLFTILNVRRSYTSKQYCFKVTVWNTREEETHSDSNCTVLVVYARPRIVNHTPDTTTSQGSLVELRCNASGDPRPSIAWTKMTNGSLRRLSNSSSLAFNITGKESSGNYCCVAANQYAKDTACALVNVGVRPFLMNTTAIYHRMTNNSVTIACQATGTPTPTIIWTANFSNNVINQSRDGNLTVPFKPCINEILMYYCAASNIMGNTSWKSVTIQVNTLLHCDETTSETPDQPRFINDKMVAIVVAVVCTFAMIILAAFGTMLYMKQKITTKNFNVKDESSGEQRTHAPAEENIPMIEEENPYGEPIDVIRYPVNTNSPGHYAKVQEARLQTNRGQTRASSDDNNTYASVYNSRSPKKKPIIRIGKNKKSTERSEIMPLYEELPGQKNAAAVT